MPHGFCFEWRPVVLWLHIASDLVTAFSYYGISFLLFYFTRKRRDLPFQLLFWLFSAFIVLCGTTHLFSIWVLWHPNYYVEGYVKAITAAVSITTLITLAYVLPRVLQAAQSMKALVATQNKELAATNSELRSQIAARESIESALRQSQKMEAIGQLTGGIAHDFNNMLQAIGSSLELMQGKIEQGRTTEVSGFAESARKTVDRATALTNRLLAFARRQPLHPRPVNLDALILGLEDLIRSTVSTGGAAVAVELFLGGGNWTVLCDPNQLENAFLNITINARDAMPKGGKLIITTRQATLGTLDLVGYEGAEPGDYIEIAVADSGIGMDETTKLRVFEPFFTTKPTGQGTGLGLSQVYGFARQSGGLVWLRSQPGQGTTISLFLRRADAEQDIETPAPDMSPQQASAMATILLVEDEPIVRAAVAEYMRDLGYQIVEAEDGPQALRLAKQMPVVDILVTDVGLPNGMNGRQLADALRELKPRLPVLFITGYAGTAQLDQLDAGMQILGKPFTLAAFAARVGLMLETAIQNRPTAGQRYFDKVADQPNANA